MAELSIVGFMTGSLGFIITLRTAIERLVHDADSYRNEANSLIPVSGDLDTLSIQLKIWQNFWHIHDGTPNSVFPAYWGEFGSKQIKKLLSHVHQELAKAQTEFLEKYGHDLHDLLRRDMGGAAGRTVYVEAEDTESLMKLIQSFVRGRSRLQRLNTTLFTGSIFRKHVKGLKSSVDLLEDLAKKRFIEHECAYRESKWEDRAEYTATRTHLTYLADHSATTSQALRELLGGSEDHNIDFYLHYGASLDQRQSILFESARERHIPYYFGVSPRRSSQGLLALGIQCQEARRPSSSNISWHQSLQNALETLSQNEDDLPQDLQTHVRLAENRPGFTISKRHLPLQSLENLRKFMISARSDFDKQLHGEFSRSERTRLAYELAEWALLFLRTEWFSEICSCCINRLESTDLKTVFSVRINRLHSSDHVDSETGQPCSRTQWCEEELQSMHIRRLGVLLTEIAIGRPVLEVAFNEELNNVEIDFDASCKEAHFRDILRRVRRESSEDLKDAVGYCLKQSTAPRDVVQEDLESFYDHVVGP